MKNPKGLILWDFSGAPDWIRTSGLQSRSYQAVKEETQVLCGFQVHPTNSAPKYENRGSPWHAWAPAVFSVLGK